MSQENAEEKPQQNTMGTAQRLYVYAVLLVSVFVAAFGASRLAAVAAHELLPGETFSGDTSSQIANGLALLLTAGPIWLLHWRMAARDAAKTKEAAERPSRRLYLHLVLAVSLVVLTITTSSLLRPILEGTLDRVDRTDIGTAPIWLAVWAFHWWVTRKTWRPGREDDPLHRVYIYGATILGGVLIAIGLGGLLSGLLQSAYEAIFSDSYVVTRPLWGGGMAGNAAMAIVGGVIWAWHWRIGAASDRNSLLRSVYVVGAAVASAGVVLAMLASIATMLVRAALGDLEVSVVLHLDAVPVLLGYALAHTLIWLYHMPIIVAPHRSLDDVPLGDEAAWAYRYLVRFQALASLSTASVLGIALAVAAIAPDSTVIVTGGDWWRNLLAGALGALIVGAPLWAYFEMADRGVDWEADGVSESRLKVRRIYLFAVMGAGLLAAMGGAASLLYILLNDLLTGVFGTATMDSARWALAVMITGAAAAALHRRRIGEDIGGALAELRPTRRREVTLIAPAGAAGLHQALENALDSSVEWRHDLSSDSRVVDVPDRAGMNRIVETVRSTPGHEVLIVAGPAGLQVASYD